MSIFESGPLITPRSIHKDQWHLLYYLLAAFDLITILASILLNHTLLDIHGTSLTLNQEWVQRFGRYEELADAAAKVNAPGNDVFDSRDVKGESARLEQGLAAFRKIMAELKEEIESVPNPSQRTELQSDLQSMELAMSSMVAEANLIFSHFRNGDSAKAGSRMATMDKKYAVIHRQMSKIRADLQTFQKNDLTEQKDKAASLGKFEYAFATLVVLIICLVTFYGHEMSGRILKARKLIDAQQAQIQISAKMSALGEMAGGIAHEINNPLAIIKMQAEQLRELSEADELDQAQLIESATVIERTSVRVAKIVKGLRTFARDGRGDPYTEESISSILEDTLALCGEKMANLHISLQTSIPEKTARIECRATEISQVLLNLISNSVDAIRNTQDAWIKVAITDFPHQVQISVTDSGHGISLDIRDKITQPFFTTKEVGKGTGLGLSIAKGIIESHHGTLHLDTASTNTRFIVQLPKKQGIVAPKAAA